jgi:Bacterial HORMA domain family 1
MPTGTTTNTRTATYTSTVAKIVYVTRKVQADFLAILDTYRYFNEDYAQQLISDVRMFLDEEVIDRVCFVWTQSDGTSVLEELKYTVVIGGVELADDRSGGIRYRPELAEASFHVRVIYNARWKNMPETEKNTLRRDLAMKWGPADQLDYIGGNWADDRTYSRDGYGLVRQKFTHS